jgi:hypothetical protein
VDHLLPPVLFAIPLMLAPVAGETGWAGAARGAEFRMENRIYAGDEKQPVGGSVTLFADDVVYDVLTGQREITVFDRAHGRFVLLDPAHRHRTEIGMARLRQAIEQLQSWAYGQQDPFLRFLAAPKFDRQGLNASGEMEFASPWATYLVLPQEVANSEIARAYREFSNGYCALNTLANPGGRPPFARMIVNDALGQKNLIPRQVTLILRPKEAAAAKRTVIRSEHQFTPRLSAADRQQIARVEEDVVSFAPVPWDEYQKRVQP